MFKYILFSVLIFEVFGSEVSVDGGRDKRNVKLSHIKPKVGYGIGEASVQVTHFEMTNEKGTPNYADILGSATGFRSKRDADINKIKLSNVAEPELKQGNPDYAAPIVRGTGKARQVCASSAGGANKCRYRRELLV